MSQLAYTMFQDVLFPKETLRPGEEGHFLTLEKVLRFIAQPQALLAEVPLMIFDFETTGLDTFNDHIIEIGALKTLRGQVIGEFSELIQPPVVVSELITQITGITPALLEGKPRIAEILPKFLAFIEGSILVAHNADFDMAFLRTECQRLGIQISWPAFCTLKMARQIHPNLESRNLDTLAKHYGLTFEARHRSIGDCKVTNGVLQSMLKSCSEATWQAMQPFAAK